MAGEAPVLGVPAVEAAQPVVRGVVFPPGVKRWQGEATGSWWAMAPGVGRLIEAATEESLAARVREAMYGPAL
ncbi:hypothetical protein [Actinomadura nitritigenes]|uniref:hypothetical protein n=1 Tax=Actinomadura nitritigenes TaxID=134602 RepID=UPI003D94EC1A